MPFPRDSELQGRVLCRGELSGSVLTASAFVVRAKRRVF